MLSLRVSKAFRLRISFRLIVGQLLSFAALLIVSLGTSGCSSLATATTADVSGIAGAGVASAVTRDATIATGIGLGIAAGAGAGLQYVERRLHRAEQDEIAGVAGSLPPGRVGVWSITHDVPLEDDEHGELTVVRALGDAGFDCKEIVFSVDSTKPPGARAFYTATVCRDGEQWKWASAEPATERWGALQ